MTNPSDKPTLLELFDEATKFDEAASDREVETAIDTREAATYEDGKRAEFKRRQPIDAAVRRLIRVITEPVASIGIHTPTEFVAEIESALKDLRKALEEAKHE